MTPAKVARERSRFDRGLTLARAVKELEAEVERWGGRDLSIVPDGYKGRDLIKKTDPTPGCTISFKTTEGRQFTRKANHYDRLQCNIWAFYKTLDALRGVERWGCTTAEASLAGLMLDAAATDHLMLPAGPTMPKTRREAAEILGVAIDAAPDEVKAAYRTKAKSLHPDRLASDGEHMKALNAAKALFKETP